MSRLRSRFIALVFVCSPGIVSALTCPLYSPVIWRNKTTGDDRIWQMNGLTVQNDAAFRTLADTNWKVKAMTDLDGDGQGDSILRNSVTGENLAWFVNGASVARAIFLTTEADLNWEIVGAGDFDGDGKGDLIWRNSSTGQNKGWLMNGAALVTEAFLPT